MAAEQSPLLVYINSVSRRQNVAFNPFKPKGLSFPSQLDDYISNFRTVACFLLHSRKLGKRGSIQSLAGTTDAVSIPALT